MLGKCAQGAGRHTGQGYIVSRQGQSQGARARTYILAHKDQSKFEQAMGSGVSQAVIARMRARLVAEGLLPPARKAPPTPVPRRSAMPDGEPLAKPPTMLDHEAMTALAEMIDTDDLDDDEVHRRLLKQCLQFAFNPKLHPDTRMSASQMWGKFRDQGRARDLGPGIPVTFEDGVIRLSDMMQACGPKMTVAAVKVAFDTEGGADGQPDHQAALAGGPAEAPGAA